MNEIGILHGTSELTETKVKSSEENVNSLSNGESNLVVPMEIANNEESNAVELSPDKDEESKEMQVVDNVELNNVAAVSDGNDQAESVSVDTSSPEKDESKPLRLTIEGFDDQNEETSIKTVEEIQNYIGAAAVEYLKDLEVNPLLVLKSKTVELNTKMQRKNDELGKIKKLYEVLNKDQKKFLTYIGMIPKPEMKSKGVSVDLPWLPDAVPPGFTENVVKAKPAESGASGSVLLTKAVPKKTNNGPIECIDLTDDADPSPSTPVVDKKPAIPTAGSSNVTASSPNVGSGGADVKAKHPAPLPAPTTAKSDLLIYQAIPVPRLKISAEDKGIILQWDIPAQAKNVKLQGFEIFGYQEKNNVPITCALWKKIGFVRIMPLPMSCSLTQFVEGFKYHFTIRAVDPENRFGAFSDPASITFFPRKMS